MPKVSKIAQQVRNIVRPVRSSVNMASVAEVKARKGKDKVPASKADGIDQTSYDAGIDFATSVAEASDKRIDTVRQMFDMPSDACRVAFHEGFKAQVGNVLEDIRAERDAYTKGSNQWAKVQRAVNSQSALFSRLGTIIKAIAGGHITKRAAEGCNEHQMYALCPKGNSGRQSQSDKPLADQTVESWLALTGRVLKMDGKNPDAKRVAALEKGFTLILQQLAQCNNTRLPVDKIVALGRVGRKHLRRAA
jgi:hypothetical protein